MSNTNILPPVVFAAVPGIGTVVSKWTDPSFPSRSMENASVASIAAAKMLTAVHNSVRFLTIGRSLVFLSSLTFRLSGSIVLFGYRFNDDDYWLCSALRLCKPAQNGDYVRYGT